MKTLGKIILGVFIFGVLFAIFGPAVVYIAALGLFVAAGLSSNI